MNIKLIASLRNQVGHKWDLILKVNLMIMLYR